MKRYLTSFLIGLVPIGSVVLLFLGALQIPRDVAEVIWKYASISLVIGCVVVLCYLFGELYKVWRGFR